jgi:glycosyltransferase involved in cell wall biosynthesis
VSNAAARDDANALRSHAPRVSVLLPVHDAERYLAEAVESILGQTFPDFELLAIDDGSRDGSAALLERYARRDPRVRLVRRAHAGLVATLNAGLALARGELVARMDADDVALPRRLELQVARLDLDPDLLCVGGAYEVIDARGRRIDLVRPPEAPEQILAAALEGRSPICHPAALYRRDRVIAVGGYDVAAPVAQDYDLWLRLMDVGRLANLSEVVLRLRYHAGSVSEREQAKQMAYASRLCEAARRRRGLSGPPPPLRPWRPLPDRLSQQEFALAWCRSAWRLGERRTALAYAVRAALLQPFSAQLLRLIGHELRCRVFRRERSRRAA